jgi:hypothetical protein
VATSSTVIAKTSKWRAFCLRCDKIDRNAERWLLLTFYALIILTIAIEVFRRFVMSYSFIWPGLLRQQQ